MKTSLYLLALLGLAYGHGHGHEHKIAQDPVGKTSPTCKRDPRQAQKFAETDGPKKRVLCGFGVDVDAVSGWINTAASAAPVELTDVSRGIWGGTVGVDRMLSLFARYDIRASFFVPGHSLESFPASIAKIRDAGHEIGLHGYTHEFVTMLSEKEERAVMKKCVDLITEFTGKHPRGYTAPSWAVSNKTIEILESFGIMYDHSFHHHDSQPYYLPYNPWFVETNTKMSPEDWMHPMSELRLSSVIEIPGNWHLDDWPPLNTGEGSQGYVDPDVIYKMWTAQFDYYYREYDSFIFPVSLHPDVSGKAHVQLMLERLIEYISSYEGVEWMPLEEIAKEFKSGSVEGYTFAPGVSN